jgi:hypothetical protein
MNILDAPRYLKYASDIALDKSGSKSVRLGEYVKTTHLHILLDIVNGLHNLAAWAANDPTYMEDSLTKEDHDTAEACLAEVRSVCEEFGFKALVREVERGQIWVASDAASYKLLKDFAENLKVRIRDEFEDVLFLWIEEKDSYQKDDLFGSEVGEQFKDASFDIKEAGTCFALGRYTACVYHLMRVTESGLRVIGKRVGYSDERPVWEAVLKYIDAELRRNYNEMSALFKGDVEFISGISAQMHAVNLAWRRRVAHIERTYSEEEARRIFDSTRNLMQHIASKLSEVQQ